MHLSRSQALRFFRLFYSLLDYVNEKHGVLGEPFDPMNDDLRGEQVGELSYFIFEDHRDVIDAFIRENPSGMDAADLGQIARWKEALSGSFTIVEHGPHGSVFMGNHRLFNVRGISQDISDMVRDVPTPVSTVLLPFDGCIVYGVSIARYPVGLGPGILGIISDEYRELLAKGGPVATDEEFLKVSPLCRVRAAVDAQKDRAFQRKLEECPDGPDSGMHVGALAGLGAEEREAAIQAHMDELRGTDRRFDEPREAAYLRHAPVRTLAETFMCMTKNDALRIAKGLGCTGCSKLKKPELAQRLSEFCAEKRFSVAESLAALPYGVMFELGRRTYLAGGLLEMDIADHEALSPKERFRAFGPMLNVFVHGGKISCVIPDEFMDSAKDDDWDRVSEMQEHIEHARHLAETYLNLCGLISVKELTELYLRYYPDGFSASEFDDFIFFNGLDSFSRFDIWYYGCEPHIVDFRLIDDAPRCEFGEQVVIDGDDMAVVTDEERFRRYLLSSHGKVAPWEVPSRTADELEGYVFYDAVLALPSQVALRDFLDANVPDGQDDYFFAENVIEDLIEIAQFDFDPSDIIDELRQHGLEFESPAKLSRMLTLVMNFTNDVPRWSNNGWSPAALHERETGRKIFRDENGKPLKVKVNDPCPCGSGKKYKKCCGKPGGAGW